MLPDISGVCPISHIILDAGPVSFLFQTFFATKMIWDGCLVNVDVQSLLHAVAKVRQVPDPNEKQFDLFFGCVCVEKLVFFYENRFPFWNQFWVPNPGPKNTLVYLKT